MAAVNLALRFILEIAGIVALGYWGFTAGSDTFLRIILGVGAPVVLIAVWALVVAPRANNQLSQLVRMALGTVLLEGTAAALFMAGRPALGVVLALVVLANAVLMVVFGSVGARL